MPCTSALPRRRWRPTAEDGPNSGTQFLCPGGLTPPDRGSVCSCGGAPCGGRWMTATRQYGAWARCCPTPRSAPLGLVRVVTAAGALGDHSPARVSGSEPSPRSASGSAGRGHRRGGDRANSDRPRLRPEAAVRGSVGSGQLGAAQRGGLSERALRGGWSASASGRGRCGRSE